ncbi:MAG: SpoIIM [uncultured Solirubrobacteraceae bacterium]|uniref:SpoIIM n=1 Tax=uncultured Solirubrobacteraceae bacterium TaxID=1162706 RepID=A0A6J4SZZ9_9ACTN|nr:MAG: SpoIIM [uncultured Solirubrobacteraceae bacterium]
MRLQRFESERRPGWVALEALLVRARGKPGALGADGVRELGARYREAAADLALARRAFPAEPITPALEALVARARQAVYAEAGPARSPRRFFTTGLWRAIAGLGPFLAVSALLFFGTIGLGMLWGATDPDAARGMVPGGFLDAADPPRGDRGLTAAEAGAFSSQIFVNNIRVGLLVFAAGILFGVGAGLLLIYNGLIIGALLGVALEVGTLLDILRLITAHGVLELSGIVVEGAAGLALGWALVDPGRLTRRAALAARARPAMAVVLGLVPFTVLAGLAEGFVSPAGASWATVLAVGFGLGFAFWGLVVWRGLLTRDARSRGLGQP